MRRPMLASGLLAFALVLASAPIYAQQTVSFYVGGIHTPDLYGRPYTDVFLNNTDFLTFDLRDLSGPTVGGEYLIGMGRFIDAGAGVGFYSRTVPSVYDKYVNRDGTEIRQDLGLRMVPITATFRVLPFGRSAPIQPYFGAGVAIVDWRYSEQGQFVDFKDGSIFRDSFQATGTSTGAVVIGGVKVPVGAWAVGGEVRWQDVKGNLPAGQGFAGETVDLGGWNYLATFSLRF